MDPPKQADLPFEKIKVQSKVQSKVQTKVQSKVQSKPRSKVVLIAEFYRSGMDSLTYTTNIARKN